MWWILVSLERCLKLDSHRLCVLVVVVISLLWVPIIKAFQGSQLFVYIQVVSSYFQPPICAVYLAALFWKRLNEPVSLSSFFKGALSQTKQFHNSDL